MSGDKGCDESQCFRFGTPQGVTPWLIAAHTAADMSIRRARRWVQRRIAASDGISPRGATTTCYCLFCRLPTACSCAPRLVRMPPLCSTPPSRSPRLAHPRDHADRVASHAPARAWPLREHLGTMHSRAPGMVFWLVGMLFEQARCKVAREAVRPERHVVAQQWLADPKGPSRLPLAAAPALILDRASPGSGT